MKSLILFSLISFVACDGTISSLRIGNKEYTTTSTKMDFRSASLYCNGMVGKIPMIQTEEELIALDPLLKGGHFWTDAVKNNEHEYFRSQYTGQVMDTKIVRDVSIFCSERIPATKCVVITTPVHALVAVYQVGENSVLCVTGAE